MSRIWRPSKGPQEDMVTCPCFELFFGGARGGGKTDGMLGEWLAHHEPYNDKAIGLMIRRELTQLKETIERSRQIYTPLGAKFNEQEKMWRMPNGARLRFAYLERDSDADAYMGHNYTRIYVEEIGTFPNRAPINKLMATLRSGHGVPVGFRSTGNPGGPGHNHVKARYVDPHPPGYKIIYEEFKNPWTGEKLIRDRVFIPSKVIDNPYLADDYVANIQMSGSAALVKAWLEGNWDIVDGAFFDQWNVNRHVIEPFEVPSDWLRFRSADWGYASPFSIQWWTVVPDPFVVTNQIGQRFTLPRGAIVQYREWYGSNGAENIGLRLDAEEVADGIRAREKGETIAYGVLDPSAFNRTSGPSIAERMASRKVVFRRADNTRVSQRGAISGWDAMRARLRGLGPDEPMLAVFSTSRHFIRTVPVLQHDRDKPEDLDTTGEDHAGDAGRYACSSRPWVPPLPREVERPTQLQYKVGPDGILRANMSVQEIIELKRKRRRL